MDSLLAALPALGCLVMMPAMAWVMARGMRNRDTTDPPTGNRPTRHGTTRCPGSATR